MAKTYIGANIEVPTYSEGTVNITTSNVNDYFTVTNGSYYFAGSGSTFTSNNKYVSSSTATTTFTAKTDMTNLSFTYCYSSERNYDKFTLTVGNTTVANAFSGSTTTNTYSGGSLKTGEKIVMTYSKDGSGDSYNDECYVSNISFKSKVQTGTEQKSNVAKEVKNIYIGVNNVARKVVKAYIGVNGIAHLCYGRNNPGIDGALTFIGDTDFTLKNKNSNHLWGGTLQYSTDGITWNEWGGYSTPLSSSNKKLYLRGIKNEGFGNASSWTTFAFSGANEIHCYGNIETLLDYQTVLNGNHPRMSSYYSFWYLFENCSTLVTPPELPATTLSKSCYRYMFQGCTKLNKLPKLPATKIPESAYECMFKGCSSIKLSTTQTGEYQTPYRIPTTGTGEKDMFAMSDMFGRTGGTFKDTPSINTTYYTSNELV